MRKLLMSVSLVALTAPAFAADPIVYVEEPMPVMASPERFSGHIEGYLGGAWYDPDIFDENAWIFGGAARANYMVTDRWNVQGDLFGDSNRIDEFSIDTVGGGAHVYWRDPNSFAFGVFGSVASIGGGFIGLREFIVGPEAQAYFGNVTIYGQAYYGQLSQDDDSVDVWGARGVARYFIHDNFKIEGEVGYRTIDEAFGTDLDQWTLAAQADYRFDSTPFSVFGRYQYDNFDFGFGDVDTHKVLVGFRGTFGADTLKAEDRFGATMDLPQSGLPLFPL
jgi:opacity protein-like surface antigen